MKTEIANRLYEYRRASGMSQEKVAALLGVSRQAVSKWECAESTPDTENLIKLAQLYGVSVDELLFADPDIVVASTVAEDAAEAEETAEEEFTGSDAVAEEPVEEPAGNSAPNAGEDYAHISFEHGVHVRDSRKGEEVHVGWDGIHIDSGNDHVHIDFANFKSIAQAIRAARKQMDK